MSTTQHEQWLTRIEVSQRLNVPKRTLDQWAAQGKGPQYARFGRHVRYRLSDVIAWERASTVNHSAGPRGAA